MTRSLLAAAALTVGLAAASASAQADPAERLAAMNAHYAELDTVSATVLTELRLPAFPMANSDIVHAFVLDREAGSVALRHTSGTPGGSLVLDGEQLMASFDMSRKYLLDELEGGLDAVFDDPRMQGLPIPAMFLARSIVQGPAIPTGRDARVEDLGDALVDGVAARHLRVTGDMAGEVWIAEGRTPWLLKVKPAPPGGDDLPEGADSAMIAQVTFVFRDWNAEPDLGQAFALTPPAGFAESESIMPDMSDMLGGGPGGARDAGHDAGGEAAPDVTLVSLDGSSRQLSDLRGDVVVLDFWATWCKPCLMGLPIVMEVTSEYADRDVTFFAVDVREKPKRIRGLLEKKGWDLPVALDIDGEIAKAFGVGPIPHMVIIDADGNVGRVHTGFSSDLERTLRADLDALIAQRDAP